MKIILMIAMAIVSFNASAASTKFLCKFDKSANSSIALASNLDIDLNQVSVPNSSKFTYFVSISSDSKLEQGYGIVSYDAAANTESVNLGSLWLTISTTQVSAYHSSGVVYKCVKK